MRRRLYIIGLHSFWLVVVLLLAGCRHLVQLKTEPPGVVVTDLMRGCLGMTSDDALEIHVNTGESLDLSFEKPGYEEKKISLSDIRYDRTLFVELWKAATILYVETRPAGASLRVFDLNGKPLKFVNASDPTRQTSHTNQKYVIPSGVTEIVLEIEKEGYQALRKQVKLFPKRENLFSFPMEQKYTNISIFTSPEGADVYERYFNYMGTTPIKSYEIGLEKMKYVFQNMSLRNVEGVNLHLEIRKDGYQTKTAVYPVKLYENNEALTIELKPTEIR